MNIERILPIIEIFIFLTSLLSFIVDIKKIKINKSTILFLLLATLILFISMLVTNGDYYIGALKIIIFFSSIYFGFRYKEKSMWLIVVIMIAAAIFNYVSTLSLDKFSVIPISFIALLFSSFYFSQKYTKKLLISIIAIDILQCIYTGYRGQLIYSLLVFIFVLFNINIRNKISYIFIILSFGYVIGLYFFGYNYFELNNSILPPTASNIERSSMVYWCINEASNYFIAAPTVSVFQENAGIYKSMYLNIKSIPNDPHNFFLMIYIYLGLLPSLIFMYMIFSLLKVNKKIKHQIIERDYISLALLQAIIIFSMHPFNSLSRIIVGITLGLFIATTFSDKKIKVKKTNG